MGQLAMATGGFRQEPTLFYISLLAIVEPNNTFGGYNVQFS
jgi:hypothetical protein